MMSEDWMNCLVEDIASDERNALVGGPFGSKLVSADYVEDGVPVIRGQNMGMGRWVDGEFAFVSEQKAKALSSNIARPDDIVFTQRGTLGQVAIVPRGKFERYVVSQSQMKLTAHKRKADKMFLYYLFTSPQQQRYIQQHKIQTGVPHTNLGILRNTPLHLPPLGEQKAIAAVLSAFDDKIELNRQMNATLEEIARALFKSWFVDFDPVRRNAAGGPAQPYDHLFPDTLVVEDGREIPDGWRVKPLDKIAHYQNGLALQKYPPHGDEFLLVIKIRELRQGHPDDNSNRASPNIIESCILYDGDVVFSWSGSLLVDVWCGGTGALNQHLFKVTSKSYPKWFYYFWTKHHLYEFQRIAAGKATTMGHIKRSHLSDALATVPTKDVLKLGTVVIAPIIEKIINNNLESRTLAELRDTLLPRLMSGQLRVPLP